MDSDDESSSDSIEPPGDGIELPSEESAPADGIEPLGTPPKTIRKVKNMKFRPNSGETTKEDYRSHMRR